LGAPLVGGDIASGSDRTTVTVTALGSGAPDELVTRAGARPGDALCVTGSLGGSLLGHHLDFEPRLSEALALRRQCPVHAMIDISDGLSTDALHLAEESKAGVLIEEAAVPLSGAAQQMARQTGRSPLDHALDDGEDYELLFAVAPDDAERLVDNGVAGTRISRVGRVIEGPDSYRIDAGGRRRRLVAGGWEHGGGR
jgi:thiamine-monophosphate kinase